MTDLEKLKDMMAKAIHINRSISTYEKLRDLVGQFQNEEGQDGTVDEVTWNLAKRLADAIETLQQVEQEIPTDIKFR